MTEEWYPMNKINFSKNQMLFLIRNLDLLEQGIYPPDPNSTRKIVLPSGKRKYGEPSINRVLDLSAEVKIRLGLVMNLISGWERLDRRYYRYGGEIRWDKTR